MIFFDDINHGFQGGYIEEILFVTASVLYECDYLFLLWKCAKNDTKVFSILIFFPTK